MSPVGSGTSSDGGAVAPDGSPVTLYRQLPPGPEPDLVHDAIPAGAAVLELGCGAGRVTHALIELGHDVVAVDQSEEMLRTVTGATRVHSDIETLDLDRRFPAVLLLSFLVDSSAYGQSAAFLDTCRRHVADDGVVIVQRTSPEWAATVRAGQSYPWGEFTVEIHSADYTDGLLSVSLEYHNASGATWTHTWRDHVHSDDEFIQQASARGLHHQRWLDDDHEWALLQPRNR
ncbi:class I SAM-dependent methyltransferase [Amycolatopsis sp. cg5]|uniref:class I SAM-dependent methyltransferase n=1 Tax=Amycolatopsis sp. cg5 TaxID=3238802 RepID=UPI003523B1B5